jgi:hypothetical protein
MPIATVSPRGPRAIVGARYVASTSNWRGAGSSGTKRVPSHAPSPVQGSRGHPGDDRSAHQQAAVVQRQEHRQLPVFPRHPRATRVEPARWFPVVAILGAVAEDERLVARPAPRADQHQPTVLRAHHPGIAHVLMGTRRVVGHDVRSLEGAIGIGRCEPDAGPFAVDAGVEHRVRLTVGYPVAHPDPATVEAGARHERRRSLMPRDEVVPRRDGPRRCCARRRRSG